LVVRTNQKVREKVAEDDHHKEQIATQPSNKGGGAQRRRALQGRGIHKMSAFWARWCDNTYDPLYPRLAHEEARDCLPLDVTAGASICPANAPSGNGSYLTIVFSMFAGVALGGAQVCCTVAHPANLICAGDQRPAVSMNALRSLVSGVEPSTPAFSGCDIELIDELIQALATFAIG